MEKDNRNDEIVKPDAEWLEYIKRNDIPYSHKMFTDQSYFDSFWAYAEHGIILCDDKGKIITANSYLRDLLNAQLTDLQNSNIYDLISERFLKQDYTNISAIINSTIYSYSSDNEFKKPTNKNSLIPVKIVATRVPSSAKYPFRHLIIHIYEMHQAVIYDNMPSILKQNDWKSIIKQPWFLKWIFALIGLIIVMAGVSGQLMPIIEKILEKI